MAIITAAEVVQYSDISAIAATIAASGLIEVVQDRITSICNNYFLTELDWQGTVTFDGSAGTITTVGGSEWAASGFADGDEVYIYRSYRNDGYKTVTTVAGSVMTVSESVSDELSGRSILFSVVRWPSDLKATAARMVAYDYDKRSQRTPGVSSVSLGPWSESYAEAGSGAYGYPLDILAPLDSHRIVRIM
jgi:hypothetical protein